MPFIVFRDGGGSQRLVALEGERLSVGREEGHDVRIVWDPQVSRLHALLERLGGSWTVIDDGLSRNGTLVNGVAVRGRRRLNDRDVIQFGATQVQYRDPAQGVDETSPAPSASAAVGITPAQRRVLVALCRPLLEPDEVAPTPPSNGEIAEELSVSVEAVRTHLKTLFRVFEVPELPQNRKRAELARRALASGVVGARGGD